MKKNIKIVHLTSAHERYDIRIFRKECISLKTNGYDVSLIVADGLGDEIKDGIRIYDVGKPKSRIDRILNTTKKVYKKAIELKCDIFHFHDPELIFCGLKLQRKYKVIFDIHEDTYKQIKLKTWLPSVFRNLIAGLYKKLENYSISKFSAIIVPQPSMLTEYLLIKKEAYLVENFVMLNKLQEKRNYNNKNHFHAGGLTEDRGIYNMLNAFKKLPEDYKLILAGNLDSSIEKEIENNYNNVVFLNRITHEEVLEYYKKSSVGIILYNNVGQYYLSYSIKLFEYMRYSIPVIMPDFGEWIRFNEINNCGINVKTNDTDEVVKALKYLNENPEVKKKLGENGKKAVLERYNWGICEKKLFDLYNNI